MIAPLHHARQALRHGDHQLLIRHPEPPERVGQPLIPIVADVVGPRALGAWRAGSIPSHAKFIVRGIPRP